MIKDTRIIFGLKTYENWFEYKVGSALSLNAYLNVKNGKKPWFHIKRLSYTIEISLEGSSEEIFSHFTPKIKQIIRRAQKDGIACFQENDLEKFVVFYNQFAQEKHLPEIAINRFSQLSSHLLITAASYNDQTLVEHCYIMDSDMSIVRAFLAPTKRLDKTINPVDVARANKLLSYKDMLYFKEKGFKTFDFGGYYLEEKNQGINDFKLSFGGKKVTCTNYFTIPNLLLRKTAAIFKNLQKSTSFSN